ncbi:MAG: hypothetical protein ACYSWZ_21155, partial [Planctomycetota bacterium]
SDIIKAFQDDKSRGEFIILSQSKQVYIQAAGEGYGPYSLEYRDGDEYHHFQCSQELPKPQVQAAFIEYLKGGRSWLTDLEWKRLDMSQSPEKPWWKFW